MIFFRFVVGSSEINDKLEEILFWLDEAEAILDTFPNPSDAAAIDDILKRCKVC